MSGDFFAAIIGIPAGVVVVVARKTLVRMGMNNGRAPAPTLPVVWQERLAVFIGLLMIGFGVAGALLLAR